MANTPPSKGKIIVFGILFWYPLAGVTYQFLHYMIGLRRLGYDPYYIEDSARYVYDPRINDLSTDASANVAAVAPVLESHGFGERWAYRGCYPGGRTYGLREEQILRLYRDADAFLNVTGAQELREEHMTCPRRIYVESDPFASQVRVANGDVPTIDYLAAHDLLFTFGENIGAPDCTTPTGRFEWLPTRQPVAMDLWRDSGGSPASTFSTVTTWHNKGKSIEYNGEAYYWTKDREFRKYLDLPLLRSVPFELATTTGPDVEQLLREHNWRQADSVAISTDTERYRDYIQNSRGEFTVARDQYVRPRTGWFSDRTACYLAAGRPVITEETGFSKFLPTGNGLYGYSSMEEALSAVDSIASDYAGNCRAAREVAADYFAAEKVVGSLMERAGLA